MDITNLYLWMDRVKGRKNLHPMLQGKTLVIEFSTEKESVILTLNERDFKVIEKEKPKTQVSIHATEVVLHSIWNGEQRLLAIPSHQLKVRGHYRDLLFVESVFRLASQTKSSEKELMN